MKFRDFIVENAIVEDLEAKDTRDALSQLLDSLIKARAVKKEDRPALMRAFLARERKGTTAFGSGVAIPHVKHNCANKFVGTVGRSKAGLDFSALDHKPVHILFLLISPPDKPVEHLKVMEHIFRTIKKQTWCRFFTQAKNRSEVMELLDEADEENAE